MSAQSSPPSFNVDDTDADTPPPFVFNTKVMVGAVVLLLGVICFILMLHIYARWFLRRSSRLYFIGQGRVAPSTRHSTGLDKATISHLPSFVYTAAAASPLDNSDEAGKLHKCSAAMPGPECSVCLSEFQENEKVRMLPACKHIFHIDCVDMWLLSHTTCPLCRTDVVPSMVQTDQLHQEQEAMAPSAQIITEANLVMVPLVVEYPCNVLFWGDQTQVISSLETPVSNVAIATTLPQITIDIPPRDHANVLVGASGSLSAKGLTDEEAGSSQALRSPSQLGASIKKMLSRQSSRHKSQRQEGNEESSPK